MTTPRQPRSSAALSPPSTPARRLEGRVPRRSESFARSSVVTWWQRAKLDRLRPPAPNGSGTEVGPRSSWALDVETGTTITVRHPETRLKPSCETTMTGRRPCCSEPDRGLRSAQKISPRLSACASGVSSVTPRVPGTLPQARGRGPRAYQPSSPRRLLWPRGGRPFSAPGATSRSHTGLPRSPAGSPAQPHHEGGGTSAPEGEGESFAPVDSCHPTCHSFVANSRAN